MTQTVAELNDRFGIPPAIQFESTSTGLIKAGIRTTLCAAELYLQGAHVTGFAPANQRDLLFVSPRTNLEPGKAIRGGVPICFPWFGDRRGSPGAPAHGFARTRTWTVRQTHQHTDGSCAIVMELVSDASTLATFPHRFLATFEVKFGESLSMTLRVRNDSEARFTYETALHSYIAVGDIERVAIEGLEGVQYLDKTRAMARQTEDASSIQLSDETDRIYVDHEGTVEVDDPVLRRRVRVEKQGSRSTVLWTPGAQKASQMSDLGDAWREFVCVESGNIGENATTIATGQSHAITQLLYSVAY